MTRKLIAMLLCVMMVASIITVPAFADGISYADYVPGEKPANLINSQTSTNSTMLQYFTQTNASVAKVAWNNWTQIRVTSQVAYDGTTKVGKAGAYMPGALIHGNIMPDGTVTNDKYYVVNFYAKAAEGLDGTVRDTKVNIGITNYRYESRLHTTKEYGADGMDVSSDWKEFKGTIYVEPVHPTYASARTAQVSLGLSTTALAGTGAIISDGVGGQPGKVYLAEEAAYDITNELTSASDILTSKNFATFKAQIVNQVGLPGYLDQGTFTWKAFAAEDTARATEISGFSFASNGNDVTVTVDDSVPAGDYVVVAYNNEKGWAKGASITVDTPSPYLDYVATAAIPENLIHSNTSSNSTNLQYFTTPPVSNNGFVNYGKISWNSWTRIIATSNIAYDGTTKAGLAGGMYLVGAYINGTIMDDDAVTNGKNYVVKFHARSHAGLDGTVRDTKANFMVRDFRNIANVYTQEYGAAGMDVSTDWKEYKGTFKLNDAKDPSQRTAISTVGLSAEAPAGTAVAISDGLQGDPSKVYIAEEILYDITNELTSASATIAAGKSASFKANLVNQIGLPGYLDQTFEWKVLDRATRKVELEGVTIEAEGNTATVTTTKATVPGEYVVVAYNAANEMAKGVDLTITAPNYYEDYVRGEKPANMVTYKDKSWNQFHQESDTTVAKRAFQYTTDYMKWTVVGDYDGSTTIGKKAASNYLPGGFINHSSMLSEQAEYDETYVISFNARNNTENNAKINAAFLEWRVYNKTSSEGGWANMQYTKEYGIGGLELTGTDWHEFKGTTKLHAIEIADGTNTPWLQVGFAVDCLKGTGADFRYSDMYLAKEVAYDITNELATGSSATLADGASAAFEAEVINQIGLPGYLDQTFEWRVMDKARENDIAGFTIAPSDDTASAEITVNGAAPGTYDVVAYNAANKMAMGYEITVPAAVEEVTKITLDESVEGKITLSAAEVENTAATEIMFVIASYNTTTKKMIEAKKSVATVADGKAVLAETITIDVTGADAIRVFAWDTEGYRPIALADGVIATK